MGVRIIIVSLSERVMTALYPHPTAFLVRWRGLRYSLRVGA